MNLPTGVDDALFRFHLVGQCLQCLADLTSPTVCLPGVAAPAPTLDNVRREDLTSLVQLLTQAHTSAQTSLEAALAAGSDA